MLSRAQASLSPNGISSGSAVFAALTVRLATHRLDHVTYIIGGNRPRLRYMHAMRPKTALHYSSRYELTVSSECAKVSPTTDVTSIADITVVQDQSRSNVVVTSNRLYTESTVCDCTTTAMSYNLETSLKR